MIGNGIWFLASAYLPKAFSWPLEGLQKRRSPAPTQLPLSPLQLSKLLAATNLIDLFKAWYVPFLRSMLYAKKTGSGELRD